MKTRRITALLVSLCMTLSTVVIPIGASEDTDTNTIVSDTSEEVSADVIEPDDTAEDSASEGFLVPVEQVTEVPEGYVGIYTAEDLYNIRNDLDGNYILMNDIDLSVYENWEPLPKFQGILNGNGHNISNLISNKGGLCSILSGQISNLGVVNCQININLTSSPQHYGVLANTSELGIITNCYTAGNICVNNFEVTDTDEYKSLVSIGGFCGRSEGISVFKSINACDITLSDIVITDLCMDIGAFLGCASDDPNYLEYVINKGDIILNNLTSNYIARIGGIIGEVGYSDVDVEHAINIGNMEINYNATGTSTNSCVGGIIGWSHSTDLPTEITYSSNYGNISGSANGTFSVGGISGVYVNVESCYNAGNINFQCTDSENTRFFIGGIGGESLYTGNCCLSNCYNTGSLSAEGSTATVGGICGYNATDSTISNCYNIGNLLAKAATVSTYARAGHLAGSVYDCETTPTGYYLDSAIIECDIISDYGTACSDSQLQDIEYLDDLDFETIWEIGVTEGYDYPTLRDNPHVPYLVIPDEEDDVIEPDPVEPEQIAPTITGLQDNYTLTLGDTLTLDGMITAGGDGKLTAVNLQHNETDSAFDHRRVELDDATFSLSDFGVLTTDAYPLNAVGTYEFCVYAAATNYTVTDNLVGVFTVTVVGSSCQHDNASILLSMSCHEKNFIDYDISSHSYTYYPHQELECLTCHEVYTRTLNTPYTVADEPHYQYITLDHGYMCECGYLSINESDDHREAYLNSDKTQEPVYKTYDNYLVNSNIDYSYVYSTDTIEIICSYKDCYFIKYPVSNSSQYKYRFINKDLISFDSVIIDEPEEKPEIIGNSYSLYTTEKNYVEGLHYNEALTDFYIISDVIGKIKLKIFNETEQVFLTESEFKENFELIWTDWYDEDNHTCPYIYDADTRTFDVFISSNGIIELRDSNDNIIDYLNVYYSPHKDRIQPLQRYIPYGVSDPRLKNAWNIADTLVFDWNDVSYDLKADGYHIDLTFYNHQHNYFILTTYDSSQTALERYVIAPFAFDIDAWNAVGNAVLAVYDLTFGIASGNLINGKALSVSKITDLSIVVPAGGYFTVEDAKTSDLALCLDVFNFICNYLQMSGDLLDVVTLKSDLEKIDPKELISHFSSEKEAMDMIAKFVKKHLFGDSDNYEIITSKNTLKTISELTQAILANNDIMAFITDTILKFGINIEKEILETVLGIDKFIALIKVAQDFSNVADSYIDTLGALCRHNFKIITTVTMALY